MKTTPKPGIKNTILATIDIDRIIEMAWEDRTTFESIEVQFGLKEKEVIALMRKEMKASSFKMWRKRTNGRSTKHSAIRGVGVNRFKCTRQKTISLNKISKR
ncbi:MAG TPA: TIGR03643 family protein [Segetibacter sp.]|jgi:uncharacterized protein (TIGR03643 family)